MDNQKKKKKKNKTKQKQKKKNTKSGGGKCQVHLRTSYTTRRFMGDDACFILEIYTYVSVALVTRSRLCCVT